jgi:RNA polymerase sigma-70 factor (ECF subfamily)
MPSDNKWFTIEPDAPIPLHGDADPMTDPASETRRARRFERDVLPLAHQLFTVAMRLAHNTQDAEDLAQEVMLRAYAGFGSFQDGTNIKAWLLRILHNTWINQYRKRKSRPDEISVERIPDWQLAAVILRASNASRSAEDSALELMADEEVARALAALREDVRTTVYYADVLEFSCKEIAVITNCPIGTVMSRLHRGRKRLRTSLIAAATRRGFVPEEQYVKTSPAA